VNCPDLKQLFGADHQVRQDEAAENRDDPAMYEIPARYGRFYSYGDGLLAVEVDYHNKVAAQVGRVEGTTLVQDGDDEKTFTFPVGLFPQVAALVHPYRRQRCGLTEEQKAALVRAGVAHRFRGHGADPGLPGAPARGSGEGGVYPLPAPDSSLGPTG
jgi:hypothetical protein